MLREEQLDLRRQRAAQSLFRIENLGRNKVFSDYRVKIQLTESAFGGLTPERTSANAQTLKPIPLDPASTLKQFLMFCKKMHKVYRSENMPKSPGLKSSSGTIQNFA